MKRLDRDFRMTIFRQFVFALKIHQLTPVANLSFLAGKPLSITGATKELLTQKISLSAFVATK